MQVHLTRRGHWVRCAASVRACPRRFHIPNTTPAAVTALPTVVLEQLLEAFDPPTHVRADGTKEWLDGNGHWHREYDLPALIDPDGTRSWYIHNIPTRPDDLPHMVYPDGSMEWYDTEDELHRAGGLPALIYPEYQAWYEHGQMLREAALTPEGQRLLAYNRSEGFASGR